MISLVQLIVTFVVKLRRSDLFYFLFLFKWADSQTSNQVGWFNPNLMSRTNPKISSQEKWRLSFLLGIDFSLYSQLYSLCLGAEIEPNVLFFFLPYFSLSNRADSISCTIWTIQLNSKRPNQHEKEAS